MELLVSREKHPENSIIKLGNISIGQGGVTIIAGPCTIESKEQLFTIGTFVKEHGADILRGGAFKPRTSPYSFQGLGTKALDFLVEAGQLTNLPTVSEILSPVDLPFFADVDMLQVGAKNMQNYSLLKALGNQEKPVLLKRGWSNTLEEFILSAEYILKEGNSKVILCERGIRTFETSTRNSFDINAIPLLKEKTHLPIIADPSHGTGVSSLVSPVSFAAVAAGADGLMIEVHNNPGEALCDGFQATTLESFEKLEKGVRGYEKLRNFNEQIL